jgi:hypothetical protein
VKGAAEKQGIKLDNSHRCECGFNLKIQGYAGKSTSTAKHNLQYVSKGQHKTKQAIQCRSSQHTQLTKHLSNNNRCKMKENKIVYTPAPVPVLGSVWRLPPSLDLGVLVDAWIQLPSCLPSLETAKRGLLGVSFLNAAKFPTKSWIC